MIDDASVCHLRPSRPLSAQRNQSLTPSQPETVTSNQCVATRPTTHGFDELGSPEDLENEFPEMDLDSSDKYTGIDTQTICGEDGRVSGNLKRLKEAG